MLSTQPMDFVQMCIILLLLSRHEEKAKRADEIATSFKAFKIEVAKSCENSKTGRGIPTKVN